MKLQTNIPIKKKSNNLIDYNSNILLLGSCFSENIGERLEYFKFRNVINPFGILFHPLAIEKIIHRTVNSQKFTEADTFEQNELWFCFESHSRLNASSKKDVLSNLNKALDSTIQQLHDATHIIITFGTSWVYKYKKSKQYVANCHKIPQKEFDKELLAVGAIEKSISKTINLIRSFNTKVQIIFTISPVRHLKDGFVENTQSKAHLITAIHNVLSLRAESRSLNYFPSYEIMLDELRDYRFYKDDMVHPNHLAIKYIFERFKNVWINSKEHSIMAEVSNIQKGLQHRPFNENSKEHQAFQKRLKLQISDLKSRYRHMQF